MALRRRLALIAAAGTLAVGSIAAGCGSSSSSGAADTSGGGSGAGSSLSGDIAGAGSSAQGAAQEAWRAGFQEANPDVTVSYDPVGSGGGREQFVAGGIDFAGSDAALADDELTAAQKRCGGVDNLIEVPVYVSPIAIAYNVSDLDSLQLSPATLAKIFKHEITKWNDPAIAADNPGVDLPGTDITTVSRSDKSGTTQNFADYLSKVAPSVWTYDVADTWPVKGGESAQGTSGVVDAIGAGDGTIGYADESQVGDLGIAKIKVGASYIAPSADAAAKILDESPRSDDPGANVFTYSLKRDTASEGVYPLVLTSYAIACTTYDSASKAAIVKGYISYIAGADGQAVAASAAGSAPLSPKIDALIAPAIASIGS